MLRGQALLEPPWMNFAFDFELNLRYCVFRHFFLLSRFLCLPQLVTLSLPRVGHDFPPPCLLLSVFYLEQAIWLNRKVWAQ